MYGTSSKEYEDKVAYINKLQHDTKIAGRMEKQTDADGQTLQTDGSTDRQTDRLLQHPSDTQRAY